MYLPVLVVAVLVVVGLAKDLKIHNIVVAVDLPPFTPNPTEITKVMIIGDSITQGYEGDYSWRYRIWQWFEKQKYSVDFVGPYAGTHSDYSSYEPSVNGGYAEDIEEDWDSDHFSLWGHTIWQFKDKIHQQVLIDEPDMLLVELGFNDMFWRGYSPPDILSLMKEFVDNARAAKPNIVLALADIPQMLDGDHGDIPITTDAYNVLLEKTIPEWSTELSPIKLVRFREHYTCGGKSCNSTHDGLHPNALGEFELAVAFSETLVELGIGKSAMVIPDKIPERPCPVPTNLHVETTEQGRQVTVSSTSFFTYGISLTNIHSGTRFMVPLVTMSTNA